MPNARMYLEIQEQKRRKKLFSLKRKLGGSQDVSERLTRSANSLRRVRKQSNASKDHRRRAGRVSWRSLWEEFDENHLRIQENSRRLQELSQRLQEITEQLNPLLQEKTENDIRVLLGECVSRFHKYVADGLNFKWSKLKSVLSSERVLNPNNHWIAPRHRMLKDHLEKINFTTEEWDTSIAFTKSRILMYHEVTDVDASTLKEYQRKVYDVLSQYPLKDSHMLRKIFCLSATNEYRDRTSRL